MYNALPGTLLCTILVETSNAMNLSSLHQNNNYWFPGRLLGGISLVLAPLLLLTAELLLFQFHFFFPDQLRAFKEHPQLVTWGYNVFLAGNILLWPAVVTVTRLIGQKRPALASWGGALVMFGLFARTFHYGINHQSFQLADILHVEQAIDVVSKSYGAFHIVSSLSMAILSGWIVLAIGCYLSGTLNVARSVALAMMSLLMIGVLKGSSVMSIVYVTGLCIAFVPLGVKILLEGEIAKPRIALLYTAGTLLLLALMYFLGQAG
jgi:hypothetical protein